MRKSKLAIQVLIAVVLGVAVGFLFPAAGAALKPLADVFVNMIKMIIAPLILVTIVVGIAGMGDAKKAGRIGGKAILYFEIVTTFALMIGLLAVNLLHPGAGLDVSKLAKGDITAYTKGAAQHGIVDFLVSIVPTNIFDALAKGDMLPILFFAVLLGLAVGKLGGKGQELVSFFDKLSKALFGIVDLVMIFSPVGVFGAMAYTIGKFGVVSLIPLAKLVGVVALTSVVFIGVVLGPIAQWAGIGLFKFLRVIKEELLIVLGTSSSESALPGLMEKMERLGCSKSVVSLVVPTGYSFNLDGTSIYLSIAAVFIAQLFGVHLSIGQQLLIVAILMLTSKGAAAVTGGGFITLAATLAATHVVPVEGLALILGVDRFLSMVRALTNLIGNGIATLVVAKWEGEQINSDLAPEAPGADLDGAVGEAAVGN